MLRIGHGYDVHKLVPGRDLILGGVKIDFELGLLGHSDADVLAHAIMDSLLGAAGLGDIGRHFPDSDKTFKNANSLVLLKKVYELIGAQKYQVNNIDATIVAQKPKLEPFISAMRENISKTINTPIDRINIKATTEEELGFTGKLLGISAHAVCTIVRQVEVEKS